MDALSLHLPAWPTDRIRRRLLPEHAARRTPILLTAVERERTLVEACCALALSAGVKRGMPLAEARAFFRQPPHIEPLSPDDDRRDLHRLAHWAYRYVPIVAVDGDDGLLLDAQGCSRLYGGIDRLTHRLLARVNRAGITARLAAAPTFGAAWALARFGRDQSPTLIDRDRLDAALAPLPTAALRISPECIDALRAVGVERIEQLRAIPRSSLAARYGPEVLLRLDQALGHALEILTPIQPTWPTRVEHLFDGPTDRLETIMLAARGVVDELAAILVKHHCGSLSLRAELIRSDLEPLFIPVRTSEPCADAAHFWKLLSPKLERAHLGFGVEGVRLIVLRSKRLRDRQATCWRDACGHSAEVSRLIDTLHARLGAEQVVRPVAVESHIPERAFTFAPVLNSPRATSAATDDLPHDRPTVMLDSPLPIEVSLLVPDGPLVTLRVRGESRAVRACIGPERIAGEWWKAGGGGERDYFKVQTDDWRWLWLFREAYGSGGGGCGRWFLHGEWA